jgi:hypothetical protein
LLAIPADTFRERANRGKDRNHNGWIKAAPYKFPSRFAAGFFIVIAVTPFAPRIP